MQTLKQFLAEARMPKIDVVAVINAATEAGEIMKKDYDELKYELNKFIEMKADPIKQEYLYGKGSENAEMPEEVQDLNWNIPSSYLEVLSLKNKLKKASKHKYPIIDVLTNFYSEYAPLCEKFKALKDKIVTVTQKRAENKVAKEVEHKKKFADSSSLVNELLKNIEEYEERAYKLAGEQYDYMMKRLEEHDWDLNKIAPAPNSNMRSEEYRAAQQLRDRFRSMTDGTTNIRKTSPSKKAKFQETNKQAAHDSYIAWISKMIDKIGEPVVVATATGNPWNGSTLNVTTKSGEEQVWHTQMIINRSKYDMLFNQFPSRRKK